MKKENAIYPIIKIRDKVFKIDSENKITKKKFSMQFIPSKPLIFKKNGSVEVKE